MIFRLMHDLCADVQLSFTLHGTGPLTRALNNDVQLSFVLCEVIWLMHALFIVMQFHFVLRVALLAHVRSMFWNAAIQLTRALCTGMLLNFVLRDSIHLTRAICIYMELSVVLRVAFQLTSARCIEVLSVELCFACRCSAHARS